MLLFYVLLKIIEKKFFFCESRIFFIYLSRMRAHVRQKHKNIILNYSDKLAVILRNLKT